MEKALVAVLLLTTLLAAPSRADDKWGIVINGKAIHLNDNRRELNENNWGGGIQYDFDAHGSAWRSFLTASSFIDSNRNTSYYAGYGLRRSLYRGPGEIKTEAGVVAFLMTRKGFNDNNPFPGILPVLAVGNRHFAVNSTYVPKLIDSMEAAFFFQFVFFLPD